MKNRFRKNRRDILSHASSDICATTPNQCVYLARLAKNYLRPYGMSAAVDLQIIDDVVSAIDRHQSPSFTNQRPLDVAANFLTIKELDEQHHLFGQASTRRLLGFHNAGGAENCDFRDTAKMLKLLFAYFDGIKEFEPSADFAAKHGEADAAAMAKTLHSRRDALFAEITAFSTVMSYMRKQKISARPSTPKHTEAIAAPKP